ncbi:ABC transporter permease [Clostridium lacusfryxellense]|uniref:ABC transporter permease n=1 Tax=Clostridium lacusfryxellense TaxID=205328 RepID=UPI001C0C54D2|nr:ABC transporter permease [Clostridium lacusfryxellense]MBU3112734.1 ABC transporter permease [Clostridium lacusfryxellense]
MKFWDLWDKAGIYIMSITTLLIFAILTPNILAISNIVNILVQVSMVAIAAAGMTFAITSGSFDLSIGSTLSLTTCVLAINIPRIGLLYSVILAILVGGILGFINGVIITKFKVQTFVATLATMIIYRGLSSIYTNGQDVTLINFRQIKMFSSGEILFIPVPIIITIFVYILFYLIFKYSLFSLIVRSVGSNERVARMIGLKVDKTIICIFIMTAVTSVIAGVIQTSELLTGNGKFGVGFELQVITATILGGTRLSGGKGNLCGTLCAAIMLGIIKNGLNLLGISDNYQRLITGIILILVISTSGAREKEKMSIN